MLEPGPGPAQVEAPAAVRAAAGFGRTVHILLSTYRGERFLPDQLESLLGQTHTDWVLHWRDDGSHDGTVAAMAAFEAAVGPERCRRRPDDGGHLGVAPSFLALLAGHAASGVGGIAAFADQDDVWLPEKLARGVSALAGVPAGRPGLYCARQMLADERMRTIGASPRLLRAPGFPDSLAQNIATGCTVMLNDAAVRLVAACPAPAATLHDWWAYLLVTASGGEVLVDPIPTVLYRQHGQNAVGSAPSPTRRGLGAMRRGPGAFMRLFRAHLAGLSGAADRLTPEARRIVARLEAALLRGPGERLRLLRTVGIGRQGFAETMLFRLWFLIG